jgi:hypothetical protein
MGFEPTLPRESASLAAQAVHAALVVTGAAAAGLLTWIVAFFVGVSADIVGILFYRPEDYPYDGAWMVGSTLLAVAVTVAILWRGWPRTEDSGGPVSR